MQKGMLGGTNQQGIKILNSTVAGKFYKYELKILGDFGDWRLVGNLDEASGHTIFEKLVKHSDIGK